MSCAILPFKGGEDLRTTEQPFKKWRLSSWWRLWWIKSGLVHAIQESPDVLRKFVVRLHELSVQVHELLNLFILIHDDML